MSYDDLLSLAGRWNQNGGVDPERAPKKIEVFDVLDRTASAKLTAHWGVDYMHLAKYDGQWKIVHVLWQSPPAENGQSSGQQVSAVGKFSLRQFQDLRWLEGAWRGAPREGGAPFFERYRFINDTTIQMTYYADSTLAATTGTAIVALRGGEIVHEVGQARWSVTSIDAAGIHFAPVRGASNAFTWAPESSGAWLATLRYPGGREVVYRLERTAGVGGEGRE